MLFWIILKSFDISDRKAWRPLGSSIFLTGQPGRQGQRLPDISVSYFSKKGTLFVCSFFKWFSCIHQDYLYHCICSCVLLNFSFSKERSVCLAEKCGFSLGKSVCLAWQPGPGRQGQRVPHVFVSEELHVFVQCFSQLSASLKIINQRHLPKSLMLGVIFLAWPPGRQGQRFPDSWFSFLNVLQFLLYRGIQVSLESHIICWQTNWVVLKVFLAWQPCRQG